MSPERNFNIRTEIGKICICGYLILLTPNYNLEEFRSG